MVLLESCKGCGASEFTVEKREGYDFLVCGHCHNTVALLSEKPSYSSFIDFRQGREDFQIVSTGIMYSGWHWE